MEGLKELPQGIPAPGVGAQSGEDEAKKVQEEQMRRDVMATVLDTAARERRMSNRPFVSCLRALNQNPLTLDSSMILYACVYRHLDA
jgi:hypothetical protein